MIYKEMLFAEISDTLTLPISDYHKLKKSLNSVLEHLGVDRCSLLYPCRTDVSTHIVPIEATTPEYPGTSKLKAHIPTNPLFQHVCKTVEGANEPIEFQFDSIESKELLGLYEKYSIKAQMVKLIELPDGEKWGLSIQQCNSARIWTDETKDVIS